MIDAEQCPDCGCKNFLLNKERGEMICRNCSFVLDDALVDFGRDTRSFEDEGEEQNGRSGAPFDPRVANNLITQIGAPADIAKLSKNTKALMNRIRKKNTWTSNSYEQNLNTAFPLMRTYSAALNLPARVEKEAAVIYRQAIDKGLALRRSIENLVIAALFIACKMQGIPKGMKEFATKTEADLKIMGKTYKMVLRELKMKVNPTDPLDYLAKFATTLSFSAKVQTRAVKLVDMMERKALQSGLSGQSIAASTLYIASLLEGERRTQKAISETTGITETTLRNRCRDLIKSLGVKVKRFS